MQFSDSHVVRDFGPVTSEIQVWCNVIRPDAVKILVHKPEK